jgi:3-isopropylmalate/(R)-2-methylmalate dehydratase large subunit
MFVPRTLYDKLWDEHVVRVEPDGTTLLYIDRHLVHEVTSPQAFEGLRVAGRKPWRASSVVATADHNTPTKGWERGLDGVVDPTSRAQIDTLDSNIRAFGAAAYFPFLDRRQGIVHVVGPEQGATLPGMTLVCGDSHTSTHGALGALAFGIGTSEVEHVLATQTLLARKSRNLLVRVEGAFGPGVGTKDLALALIGRIGTAGGTGYTIEFAGPAIRNASIEARMSLCNMAIEAGARAGMVGVDARTIEYVRGRPLAPRGPDWDAALAYWKTLHSDAGALRSCRRDRRRRSGAAGDLGHLARNGDPIGGNGAGSGGRDRSGAARRDRAGAAVHGSAAAHGDRRHRHRQGVHRLVHQLAHRGPARGGQGRAGAPHRGRT